MIATYICRSAKIEAVYDDDDGKLRSIRAFGTKEDILNLLESIDGVIF